MKYTAPINPWGTGQRRTLQAAFRHWMKPYKPNTRCVSMADWRYERQLESYGGQHRSAVGMIRAYGATNFFRGCYPGAEND